MPEPRVPGPTFVATTIPTMRTKQSQSSCPDSTACDACSVRELALFADLTRAELGSNPSIQDLRLSPGACLYRAGDTGAAIYTVREGLLKLEQYLPDGTSRIVSLLGPGQVAGLEVTVAAVYEHAAVALQPTWVCRLPTEIVARLSGKLHRQLMKKWHEAVLQAHDCTRELATGSARQRVARLFLMLASRDAASSNTAQSAHGRCRLFGREDIGALLGVTTETASRVVAQFRRMGTVQELGPNSFTCDLEALEQIATEV
ncbi:Anaerobic regulatory protein [uncultured Gammaproteobacteria bacterium]